MASNPVSATVDWLQQQLKAIAAAVTTEQHNLALNNGRAVDTQSVIDQIADDNVRAAMQASLDAWVKQQGKVASGYRNFVNSWNGAFAQARSWLQSVGHAVGLDGLGGPEVIVVPLVIVGAIAAVVVTTQLIKTANNTQGKAILGYQQLAQAYVNGQLSPSDRKQLTDFTTAYSGMVDQVNQSNPGLFSEMGGLVQWLILGGAAIILLPHIGRRLGRAA